MRLSRRSTILLRVAVAVGLAFIYIPLIVLGIYAFNASTILEWPPPGLTLEWFPKAIESTARERLLDLDQGGLAATAIALVLGTLASLAVARHRFFGRETISFLVILPIALPGIVTGVALNNTFTQVFGIDLSLFTVIVAHATFCIVVVYNNVDRPPAPDVVLLRGGLSRPRRPHLADLPLRHAPQHALGAGRRRPARLRPLLRRDHRHQLHDRCRRRNPADLDLHAISSAPSSGRSSTRSP